MCACISSFSFCCIVLCYVMLRCILLLFFFSKNIVQSYCWSNVLFHVVHNLSSCWTFFCFPCCCFFPLQFLPWFLFAKLGTPGMQISQKYFEKYRLAGRSREMFGWQPSDNRKKKWKNRFFFIGSLLCVQRPSFCSNVSKHRYYGWFGRVASAKKVRIKSKQNKQKNFIHISVALFSCLLHTTTVWYRSTVFGV